MNVTVEVVMTPALRGKLAALAAVSPGMFDPALLAAGMLIASDAQNRAPVRTGTLRRSIRAEIAGPGDVRVGSDVPYARRIEFGFDGADSLGRSYHQPARPYLRPAFEENRDRIRQAVIEVARGILRGLAA